MKSTTKGEDEDTYWSDVDTSQGMPAIGSWKQQGKDSAPESRGMVALLTPGCGPDDTDFGHLVFKIVRE